MFARQRCNFVVVNNRQPIRNTLAIGVRFGKTPVTATCCERERGASMGPTRHLLLSAIACSLVTLVQDAKLSPTPPAQTCFVDVAIQETSLCSNVFKRHVAEKAFNASDPKDLKEACCSLDRLERCLYAATNNAGCKEEVNTLVSSLLRMARNLLGDVYKTRCRFKCSSAWSPPAPRLGLLLLLAAAVLSSRRL